MKKYISLMAILLLAIFATAGYAQVKAGSVHITPTIGGYMFEGNEDMDKTLSLGLRAGYFFTKYIGVEGFVHYVPTEIQGTNKEKMQFLGYGVEGIFNILPDGKLVPFLAVGIGGTHYSAAYERTTEDKTNKIAVDYGIGLKYFLSENVALRGDVRHVIPFSDTHNNLLYTLGITFAFGGVKKVAQAAVEPPPPAPAPAVQEVKPQAAAPAVVEEVKPQAAAPVAVAPVAVAPEPKKERATLNVTFDTNKATFKKGTSLADVDKVANLMKEHPDLMVTIEGHTDNVGSAAYNKKLSQRRADAVKKYIVDKHGIDGKRITAKGFGLEKPIASNATKEGRAKNRRVEAATDYVTVK